MSGPCKVVRTDPMIDIGTLQYKRMHNLHKWLIKLAEQKEAQRIRLHLWNNSGGPLDIPQGFPFEVYEYHAKDYENQGSQIRFELATYFEAPWSIFIDDDTFIAEDFLEMACAYRVRFPDAVIGKYTRILKPHENYYDNLKMFSGKDGTEMDFVATTSMVTPTEYLHEPTMRSLPAHHRRVEDLSFSAWLARQGIRQIYGKNLHFRPIPDKYASYLYYQEYGRISYERLRAEDGWPLLCEKEK
jgi:hypothetical protein